MSVYSLLSLHYFLSCGVFLVGFYPPIYSSLSTPPACTLFTALQPDVNPPSPLALQRYLCFGVLRCIFMTL